MSLARRCSIYTRTVSANDVIRILQRDGRPTHLGEAFAMYGRIFKTLHVLILWNLFCQVMLG